MATVLSILQNVCATVAIPLPTVIFGATDRTSLELKNLIQAAADTIVDTADWNLLNSVATITGDGTTTDFDVPSDFKRFAAGTGIWERGFPRKLRSVENLADWREYQLRIVHPFPPVYRFFGDYISFMPAPENGIILSYDYISANSVRDNFNNAKTTFTADTDTFVLDARLLELLCLVLWKQRKGLDFTSELSDYEAKLARLRTIDSGIRPVLSHCNPRAAQANIWPEVIGE